MSTSELMTDCRSPNPSQWTHPHPPASLFVGKAAGFDRVDRGQAEPESTLHGLPSLQVQRCLFCGVPTHGVSIPELKMSTNSL
jgi:hypothetical protein